MHIGIFIYLKSSMATENVVHDLMYIYIQYIMLFLLQIVIFLCYGCKPDSTKT